MVSSNNTVGIAEGSSCAEEGPQRPPTIRVQPSLERLPPELRVQYDVLAILGIDHHPDLLARFFKKYGFAIREMINFHEKRTGQKLTAKVIIWCVGFDHHVNLIEEAAQWRKAA